LVAPAHGRLQAGFRPTAHTASLCGQVAGLVCTQVVVPLDRTGAVPGSITLHVEELPASGTPKGVMFLVAGGPGQGSAYSFGLGDPTADANYSFMFPGYTLVAYDDRGTGNSGLIDCPGLQVALSTAAEIAGAGACGWGSACRAFYSTAQHAADLDAVRQRWASTRSVSTASRTARSSRWHTRSGFRSTSTGFCSDRWCRRTSRPVTLRSPGNAWSAARICLATRQAFPKLFAALATP
jgi:hypothetical protein